MINRKIMRLSWQNYKGLADGEIAADGHDVIISGRNGAGKSSIASLITFVLFGKVAGTVKRYDASGTAIATITPSAQIEFDDGTVLRREICADNRSRVYINGAAVKATQFDAFAENYTKCAGMLIINPFEFASRHWQEQRNFLLRNFGKNGESSADFEGLTVDVFKTKCATELKSLKREATGIPFQIAELERQLNDLPQTTLEDLKAQIAAKAKELSEMQSRNEDAQLLKAQMKLSELEREKSFLARELRQKQTRRQSLLKTYHDLGKACPMCGAVLTASKLKAAQVPIVTEGKAIANEITALTEKLKSLEGEICAAQKTLTELEAKRPVDLEQKKTALQRELANLQDERAVLSNAEKISERMKTLTARERELNARIAELEGKLAQAEEYLWRQMQESETAINAHFEQVTFKLYRKQANGEVKETCEAMLGGVPYNALSKGEKLKVALDILQALQKHFGLAMPLMVDDAESYTSNSYVEVTNQLFLFKVTEEDLSVEVTEGRLAA